MTCWIGIITTSSSPVVRCLVTFVVRRVLPITQRCPLRIVLSEEMKRERGKEK